MRAFHPSEIKRRGFPARRSLKAARDPSVCSIYCRYKDQNILKTLSKRSQLM